MIEPSHQPAVSSTKSRLMPLRSFSLCDGVERRGNLRGTVGYGPRNLKGERITESLSILANASSVPTLSGTASGGVANL